MRRPRDVVTAVVGLLLLIWALLNLERTPSWEQSLSELVRSSPQWVHTLLAIGFSLSLIYSLLVIGALFLGGEERRPALRDVIIVAVGAATLVVFLSLVINGAWPYVLPEIDLQDPAPRFPVLRVAVVTGILVVSAPHVTRPLRRFGWVAIITTALASVALGYETPTQTIGSIAVGLVSAGLLLLVAGSPRGYPDPETVAAALTALGVPNRGLIATPYQTWGVIRFVTADNAGAPVDVKVHGRDAFDSQLAAKAWHTLWYRETSRAVGFSRLQAVEHEALMTLLADRAGISVPELAGVGSASAELSLISFRRSGVALPDIDPDTLTDDLLARVWEQVRLLHDTSMSHGSLRASAVHLGRDGPILTDFALGSLAAADSDQGSDVAELLFSLAVLVGQERAVRTALAGLGRERLVASLPYLQPPAVSPTTRRLAARPKKLMSAISIQVLELTGAEAPEPVELRRVTARSVVMSVLLLLVVVALISAFSGMDFAEIWNVLQSANWSIIALALIVGHTQFFPQATATMFVVPAQLPFWPLLVLQTASQFISLAIPSTAGRVAMNAAFLHKFGIPVASAVTLGAIDGFSGFLVQAAILILLLVTGQVDLGVDIDASGEPWLLLLGVLGLVAAGVVIAVVRIRWLRERVLPVVRQARGAFMGVLRQPSRAIGLLTSNFVYWNVVGLTLWLILRAVGVDLGYGSALFVAASTSLVAGFVPVPGGVGVAEATLTALLVALGVDESTAFAVAAAYRIITFYLPAVEGFFGTHWLEEGGYI